MLSFKVKLSPKCNLGFVCECIWVKPSGKSIITTKEAFLKHKEDSTRHETLLVVSPASLHMNTSTENIVCVHSLLKRRFLNITCDITSHLQQPLRRAAVMADKKCRASTHIQSQIKPRLLFGESFTLRHEKKISQWKSFLFWLKCLP